MKIERIQIDGFGCHKDLMLSFNQDFNILYGKIQNIYKASHKNLL